MNPRAGSALVGVTLGLLAVLGCQSTRSGTGRPGAPSGVSDSASTDHSTGGGEPVWPAHLQATVYEIEGPVDRLGTLDARKLAKEGDGEGALLTTFSSVGAARVLYRIDQPVNLYSERITVGGSEPMVTGTRMDARGNAINNVTYQNVGVILGITAKSPSAGSRRREPDVTLDVRLAVLGKGGPEIAPGRKAAVPRTLALEHTAPLRFNRSVVMLSSAPASEGPQGSAVAYVMQYRFSHPADR